MANQTYRVRENCIVAFFLLIALFPCVIVGPQAHAQASPEKCHQAFTEAQQKYRANNADAEIIVILQRCLSTGQPQDSMKVKIYSLLSRAHLARKDTTEATRAVHQLLDVDSTFAPDLTNYITSYRNFFRDAKGKWQPKSRVIHVTDTGAATKKNDGKRGSKKWFYVGGGAVAAGVAAIIFWPKDGEFPEPPARPTK